jgi:prepilin-type N-terminal cleavage/methylation domain-containing protein
MSRKKLINYKLFDIIRAQRGFSLIEAMIALLLVSMVATTLLGSFSTSYRAVIITDNQYQAETLVKGEIDSIKSQDYIDYSQTGHAVYSLVSSPNSFTIQVDVVPINPVTGQPSPSDNGIQLITVSVIHNSQTLRVLQDYKVNRL